MQITNAFGIKILFSILSILMVSTIRYDIMPNLTFKGSRYNKVMFVLLIISFLTLIIFPKALFFPYMMIYVLSGIVRFLIKLGSDSLVKD